MRKRRFSEEQNIGILQEHQAGLCAKELCGTHGISDAIFYRWRSKYGGMEVSDARKLQAFVAETAKLRKLLAEQMMDVSTLKKKLGSDQWRSNVSISDSLSCGRRFRVLNAIDALPVRRLRRNLPRSAACQAIAAQSAEKDLSRECLAAIVDTSRSAIRVARELDRIAEMRGQPCLVVSDNGTELTSNANLKWQEDRKVEAHCIAPGKPPLGRSLRDRLPGNGCRMGLLVRSMAECALSAMQGIACRQRMTF